MGHEPSSDRRRAKLERASVGTQRKEGQRLDLVGQGPEAGGIPIDPESRRTGDLQPPEGPIQVDVDLCEVGRVGE